MNERPEFAMELAVKGMLPKNSIGRAELTRLKLYKGAEHNNAAQNPKPGLWTNQEVTDYVREQETVSVRHRPS